MIDETIEFGQAEIRQLSREETEYVQGGAGQTVSDIPVVPNGMSLGFSNVFVENSRDNASRRA